MDRGEIACVSSPSKTLCLPLTVFILVATFLTRLRDGRGAGMGVIQRPPLTRRKPEISLISQSHLDHGP